MKQIIIHTDGACKGNPGPGGWAAILQYQGHCKEISGAEADTTNNRMEMRAAIAALEALKEPCEVILHTDSSYLKEGITSWLRGWKAHGWITRERKPVKNQDLWQQLDELARRHRVKWEWLKGHAGHAQNEKCDELARTAIATLRAAQSAPRAPSAPAPSGKILSLH